MDQSTKNAVKAGAFTALWTFIALFSLSLLGWLNDLVDAASTTDGSIIYPDPAVLVKAAVSAAAGAAAGLVGLIARLAQAATGIGANSIPKYDNKS